jgi:hypothetical protein
VDVEGYEMPVFRGAEQTLRSGKILAIFAEVVFNNKNPARRWTEFDEANTYLRPRGFDLVNFYEFWRQGRYKEYPILCNVLWVN